MLRRKGVSMAVVAIVIVVIIVVAGIAAWAAMRPAAPRKPLTLVYATTQATMSFDPTDHADETTTICVVNTYDPLLYPQKGKPPKPWIATEWSVSDDGLEWTFKIRQGVKFHSGRELTAEDVAFSMNRELTIAKGMSYLWRGIVERAEAVDKYTVKFYLSKPYAEFPATLVHLFIVDKEEVMNHIKKPGPYGDYGDYGKEWLKTHDAGSGPFKVAEVKVGEKIVFEAFKDYWHAKETYGGWPKNAPERVEYYVYGEQATLVTLLKGGKVDIVEQWLPPKTFLELKGEKGIVVQEDPDVKLFFVSMHNQKPPFDDVWVRRACSYAVNYQEIIDVVFKGGVQAVGPVPVAAPGHNDELTPYTYDLDKAIECLKNSKYWERFHNGTGFTVTYMYVSGLESERMVGELLKQYFAPLNITVDFKPEKWATMCELMSSPETCPHMVAIFHTLKYPSPDCHTYLMFHTSSWGTFMSCAFYNNTQVDQLLDQARATPELDARYALYKEVQKIVYDDAAALFLVNPIHRIAYRDWVKGYEYVGLLGFDLNFYNLRVEGKPSA